VLSHMVKHSVIRRNEYTEELMWQKKKQSK
jgi:hypothetical protein